MSRVINRNNYSTQRNSYLRFIATAINYMDKNKNVTPDEKRDVYAFITMTLEEISNLLDKTTQPWEKRGYWVKVEKFRAEWEWLPMLLNSIKRKLSNRDWQKIANDVDALRQVCRDHQPYQRLSNKAPWSGAWERWQIKKKEAGK